jgi:hypothetical protein
MTKSEEKLHLCSNLETLTWQGNSKRYCLEALVMKNPRESRQLGKFRWDHITLNCHRVQALRSACFMVKAQ